MLLFISILTSTMFEHRKRTQEKLKESEELHRTLIQASPDAITVSDLNGNITDCNQATLNLHGYPSKEELIDKSAFELIAKKDHKRAIENMKKTLEQGSVRNIEYTFLTKDGREFPAELSASVIKDSSGNPTGLIAITKDITERKKMERKLQEYAEHLEEKVEERTKELRESQDQLKKSEEMYRLLVESSNDGISIVDFEGKILFANRKLKEMYGYEKMEGMSIVENIHPDVRKEIIERIQKAAMNGELDDNVVVKALRKDGSPFWIESNTVFVKENGKPIGFLTVSRDITERKKMQERLLKAEKLAAIGELATMVGHDLRNPLQAIENATYYLNNELPRLPPTIPIPQKAIEMLQVINDSVNHADNIIRDLHDFSATKKPTLKKTNINTIVKETISQVETPKNVELITELGHLPKIKVDKDMIKRVFLNLAVNGIQAMENGGRLKVTTKKTKKFVEVSFEDTGIGMSKEKMEKLFTPFSTTKAKGMGIGLAICTKFVESHGGNIEVESEEGKGSTFTVKLPIQRENRGENQ